MNLIKQQIFWVQKPKFGIDNYLLVQFLEKNGIMKLKDPHTKSYIYVRNIGGIIDEICNHHITEFIRTYLEKQKEFEVLHLFAKNVGGYVNVRLFEMFKSKKPISDRDTKNTSYMYFENQIFLIDSQKVSSLKWEDYNGVIWINRVIDKRVELKLDETGQFEKFCFNIAKQDSDRFKSLKTIIGYLLHRYQDPANTRAVIFIDEDISFDSTANGRRGKSLLCQAISKCREVVSMNGKSIKSGSWFKNQRVTRTTDIIWYDDVKKDFDFEELYDTITSGMVVEKKHQSEFYIKPEDTPKTIISSNYIVKGTEGSSDRARRCEFEVASYYSENFSPLDEFGNRFFTEWSDKEWSLFYSFMASCIQEYLSYGLIIAEPINLESNRLINATSEFFVEFFEAYIEINKKTNNRALLKKYIDLSGESVPITSNAFSRNIKAIAEQKGYTLKKESSGGNYYFTLISKNKKDGKA